MKRLLSVTFAIVVVLLAKAVPATPLPLVYTQPDGSQVEVRLCGDEAFSYYTTLDGDYMVKKAGALVLADVAEACAIKRTLSLAPSAPAITQLSSSFPRSGVVRVPVFLCAFPDQGFTVENPQEAFAAMLNEEDYSENYGTGSAHDYYFSSSFSQLSLQFDVYGPYTVANNTEYYGGNTSSSHMKNASSLVTELIKLANADGVDFSLYDANNDGVVDNVSIFFAGHNEAEGADENTIWPHQSTLYNSPSYGGKSFGSYLMTSELRGATGNLMAGIGTYCHEFGHVLGLPDFYNTANNSAADEDKVYTLGSWDVMCNGSYNNSGHTPPLFSAFERFMMGWLVPAQITDAASYRIQPLSTSNSAFLLATKTHNLNPSSPSPSEYFLVENRQKVGWEAQKDCLPGVGLLVWHISFNSSNWTSNKFNNAIPLGADIVEAFNQNPTAATSADSYPGSKSVTAMTPVLNSGDSLHSLRLHNIMSRSDGSVSFVLGDLDGGFTFSPSSLDTFRTTYDDSVHTYLPQVLTIQGKGITSELVNITTSSVYFELQVDSQWVHAKQMITDSVSSDGSYSRSFNVRFMPSRQSCRTSSGVISVFTPDSSQMSTLTVLGVAPRPVYITQPDSLSSSNVTSSSFCVSWKEQTDAELYYVRAYRQDESEAWILASEKEVVAPDDHTYLVDLLPSHAYHVTVQAYESKGCKPNYSQESLPLLVNTAIDANWKTPLPVVQPGDGTCVLNLPAVAEAGMAVWLYMSDGRLIGKIDVPEGVRQVSIPTAGLLKNTLYVVKYATDSRIKRKDYWSKFVYYGTF